VFDCTKAGGREMKNIDVEAVRNQMATITVSLSVTKAPSKTAFYTAACPRKFFKKTPQRRSV
jgi:hypothetical protein